MVKSTTAPSREPKAVGDERWEEQGRPRRRKIVGSTRKGEGHAREDAKMRRPLSLQGR
jgi:hypothetical protein